VLSDRNPYFFRGSYAEGEASPPHAARLRIGRCAVRASADVADDPDEIDKVFGYIAVADVGDHRLHESFDANWPSRSRATILRGPMRSIPNSSSRAAANSTPPRILLTVGAAEEIYVEDGCERLERADGNGIER